MHPGSTGQSEQHRLGLIRHGVGGGNLGLLPGAQPIKPVVAKVTGPFLAGIEGNLHPRGGRVIQKQLHPVAAAECGDKVGVSLGRSAPDTVVDMGGQHLDGQVPAAAEQKEQKGHRVCPAGAGHNDPIA